MRVAITLVTIGLVAMLAALAYGFTAGNGWEEVSILVGYPWFNVSLVDVYVGFALFGMWVAFRERSAAVATAWIILILVLGNAIACAYALLALVRCRGDWTRFWLGARGCATEGRSRINPRPEPDTPPRRPPPGTHMRHPT